MLEIKQLNLVFVKVITIEILTFISIPAFSRNLQFRQYLRIVKDRRRTCHMFLLYSIRLVGYVGES